MCICTFSRCIIFPARYALNPKCCHWKQHGKPEGLLASPFEPCWKHFLTMLWTWAGAFKCLLWACARRFVSQIVKTNRQKVAVKKKMCRERTCSMWYTNMDVLTITIVLSQGQSRNQVCLEGNGQTTTGENSNWREHWRGLFREGGLILV